MTTKNIASQQNVADHDFEVRSENAMCVNKSELDAPLFSNLKYAFLGVLFGIVFVKSEVVSWFRIQEMFKLQSFHMYGIIGSAIVVGMISVYLIKKLNIKTLSGEPITFSTKKFGKGQIYGALIFGLGWAITGACPGPLYAQIGTGATAVVVTLLSAIAGTWTFGRIKHLLPD